MKERTDAKRQKKIIQRFSLKKNYSQIAWNVQEGHVRVSLSGRKTMKNYN